LEGKYDNKQETAKETEEIKELKRRLEFTIKKEKEGDNEFTL